MSTGPENLNPPKWAQTLMKWFCPPALREELEGDLLEEYKHQLLTQGRQRANRDYLLNVASFVRPASVLLTSLNKWKSQYAIVMLRNYITTCLRNIFRAPTYSLINLAGLTMGLVSCMLVFQYVFFENEADGFHNGGDAIYRVALKTVTNQGTPETQAQLFLGAGDAFKREVGGVENFTRIRADFFQEGPTLSYTTGSDRVAIKDVAALIVDSTFLDVFSFPLVKGDRKTALQTPHSIVITESTALRLFGDQDPIGKTLEYALNQGPQSVQVSAVAKDVPSNSHIQFDVIVPLRQYLNNIPPQNRAAYSDWNFDEFTTYVALAPGVNVKDTELLMNKVIQKNIGEALKRANKTTEVVLQPLKSVYFDRATDLGTIGFGSAVLATRTGNERMVKFFTIIAIITLAIALLSYINLSTVRSLDRAKEVGVRKVIGANRGSLRIQFFLESILMNGFALILAILVVVLVMPYFNSFTQTNFTLASWFSPRFLMLTATIFVVGVILSGSYPAFVLSSFIPAVALKGKGSTSMASRSRLRRFLVVLQYAPAITLLVCTVVVSNQLDFMRNMDVGLEMDKLITIRSPRLLPDGMQSGDAEAMFRNELTTISMVEAASYAGNQAGRGLNFSMPFEINSAGLTATKEFKCSGVDHDFSSVFGLQLKAGESFAAGMSATYGNPDDFIRRVLLNETAVRTFGFQKNEDAVGQLLTSTNGSRYYVHGVLEDFNWASVHRATDPVMLWYTPNNRFMTIRISAGANQAEALTQIQSVYTRLFPADVFHFENAQDVYNRQYGEDEKFASLFNIFSGMAILIASMGLFAMSAFSAERRVREIGIRKVLGANVFQIVRLLAKEFIALVVISLVVASPIAWAVMNNWLQHFAFHIDLNAIPFVIIGLAAIGLAAVTVSARSIKAAKANPVSSLKVE